MRDDGVRKHMDKDTRIIIGEGLERGDSARKIAREAGLSPSTVTREVKRNRMDWQPLFGQFFQRLRPAFLNSTRLT
jgi:IS30 family transposase